MSSLTRVEKRYLEKILGMGRGYVLGFSDPTFGEFFDRHHVDIHGSQYQTFGTSKANKLRAFWVLESDRRVGTVLSEMLDSYEADCDLSGLDPDRGLLNKARSIAGRLTGRSPAADSATTESEFLAREFALPNIQNMPIDTQVLSIVEARLDEARIALDAGAHLSVIFLCGSVLEAMLLGAAQHSPASFNQTKATPKTADGSPKGASLIWRL